MAHLPIGGPGGQPRALADPVAAGRIYTHINNTNPILRADAERRSGRGGRLGGRVRRHGDRVVSEPRTDPRAPLAREAFVARLRAEGENRYHDHHRYHILMHDGKLTRGSSSRGC